MRTQIMLINKISTDFLHIVTLMKYNNRIIDNYFL